MHRIRKSIVAASLTALAVSALAAPSSAIVGTGTIGVVNGIPGQRVDICINGKEVRSSVKYGGRTYKTMNSGIKSIKIFKADPRKCKGVKVAQKAFDLGAFADWTLVVNKQSPKWVEFDNAGLGVIGSGGVAYPGVALFAWRHAADLGDVTFKYQQLNPENPIGPAPAVTDPVWVEGDDFRINDYSVGFGFSLRAMRPDKQKTIAKSAMVILQESRRYEWYLLGTKPKNAKFIVWERPVSQPIL